MLKKTLFFYILNILFMTLSVAEEKSEVTVNGLYEGKAVLLVKGKPVLLEPGDLKQGIKLIEAFEDRAIVEIKGKRKTLFMDKSIAKEYSASNKPLTAGDAKRHIISANLIHQTLSLATFEVDYYYDGGYGDYVTMTVKTYYEGKPTQFSEHTYSRLNVGRNLSTITVSMNDKSPQTYLSDQLCFEIHWASENDHGSLDSKFVDFSKQWKR